MSELLGNEHLRKHFSSMIDRDRLHHCLLFEGPTGIGKVQMAKWLAKRIFCEKVQDGKVCNRCWHCQAVDIEDHPDLIRVGLDSTKRKLQISVQQARNLIQQVAIHPRMKELYKFFKHNGKLIDITGYDEKNLDVFSRKVLKMIKEGDQGWEDMLPEGIAEIIKREKLFGFKPDPKFTLKE
mgnify:CR=1 FL=1